MRVRYAELVAVAEAVGKLRPAFHFKDGLAYVGIDALKRLFDMHDALDAAEGVGVPEIGAAVWSAEKESQALRGCYASTDEIARAVLARIMQNTTEGVRCGEDREKRPVAEAGSTPSTSAPSQPAGCPTCGWKLKGEAWAATMPTRARDMPMGTRCDHPFHEEEDDA